MPTRRNLEKSMALEFQMFGGDPKINGYPKPNSNTQYTGPVLGTVVYNPKTEELDIVINNPKD